MEIISKKFDPEIVEWRHVFDDSSSELKVDFEFSLLGYDLASKRLDMLLKFPPGGHCRRHRHIASTVTLILDGEQHLSEVQPDGSTKYIIRRKGDYALASGDALVHDEWGGKKGGIVLYSLQSDSGVLFEYFDDKMENPWTLSIDEFVESWNKGGIYGWQGES